MHVFFLPCKKCMITSDTSHFSWGLTIKSMCKHASHCALEAKVHAAEKAQTLFRSRAVTFQNQYLPGNRTAKWCFAQLLWGWMKHSTFKTCDLIKQLEKFSSRHFSERAPQLLEKTAHGRNGFLIKPGKVQKMSKSFVKMSAVRSVILWCLDVFIPWPPLQLKALVSYIVFRYWNKSAV